MNGPRESAAGARPDRRALSAARAVSRGAFGQADIFMLEDAGGTWVIKDFAGHGPIDRFVGRRLIAREAAAYERMRDAPGLAHDWARIDRHAFATRLVPGRKLNALHGDRRAARRALASLAGLLDAWHRVGAAHLDLRGLGNVRVLDDGTVRILDLASAVFWDPSSDSAFARRAREVDRSAWRKWKARLLPDELTEEERRALAADRGRRRWWRFNRRHRIPAPHGRSPESD